MALPDSLVKKKVEGPSRGHVYANREASFSIKTGKSDTMHASSLGNIDGLWESTKETSIAMK